MPWALPCFRWRSSPRRPLSIGGGSLRSATTRDRVSYVCLFVCLFVCLYMCESIYVFLCMYVYVYVCIHVCLCVSLCMLLCLCVCVYTLRISVFRHQGCTPQGKKYKNKGGSLAVQTQPRMVIKQQEREPMILLFRRPGDNS